MTTDVPNGDGAKMKLNDFLARYSNEMQLLASLASDLDHHLGEAMSALQAGNRGQEMMELRLEAQGIDLLRQSLEQLHGILRQISNQLRDDQTIDISDLVKSINLGDMAARLAGGREGSDGPSSEPCTSDAKGCLQLF